MVDRELARGFSALRRYAQKSVPSAQELPERCDFCSEIIPPTHRHLLEVTTRQVRCVCQACSILFDQRGASEGRYLLIPDRRLCLSDFQISDVAWSALRIPVQMAFFFYSTPEARMVAYYPSPLGPTESFLDLETWQGLVTHNPILNSLEPDVEALLIDRTHDHRHYFLVPIDECYRLVALLRTHWRGLSGGQAVWQEVEHFFAALKERSRSRFT